MPDDINLIEMQSRPEPFGLCYECNSGRHHDCIGVPCSCPCAAQEATTLRAVSKSGLLRDELETMAEHYRQRQEDACVGKFMREHFEGQANTLSVWHLASIPDPWAVAHAGRMVRGKTLSEALQALLGGGKTNA